MDVAELADTLRDLSKRRLAAAIQTTLAMATADLEDRARTNIRERMRERSRALLTSVRREMTTLDGGEMAGTVSVGGKWQGLDVPYARLQEYGGTVVPVRAKYLAIPVGPALNSVGLAKYKSPRDAPQLQFVQSLKGNPLLVKLTKGAKGEPPSVEVWYVLRRSVKLPARRYLRDAWTSIVAELPDRLAASAAQAMAAA